VCGWAESARRHATVGACPQNVEKWSRSRCRSTFCALYAQNVEATGEPRRMSTLLVARQEGVVGVQQMLALGMSRDQIAHRSARTR
jgi:hypothetical protein